MIVLDYDSPLDSGDDCYANRVLYYGCNDAVKRELAASTSS